MHPILARAERLAAYLAAWLVVAGLLATAMVRQDLTWSAAFLLLLPVFLFYAFVCLSAWYVCRATPLTTSSALRLLASSATAAAVASGLLVFAARAWMSVLGAVTSLGPTMEQYERNEALLFASGVLLFLLALTVQYLLLAFEFAREAEERRLQLEVLSRDAELRALRAQVNPHFLYNSLNSISALTTIDPAGARRMCVLLADFLRDTLAISVHDQIPLADELKLTDRFLGIEQIRFGQRLQVERHVDDGATRCRVPPLLLQPLVRECRRPRHRRAHRRRRDPAGRGAPERPIVDRHREPARRGCPRLASTGRRSRKRPPAAAHDVRSGRPARNTDRSRTVPGRSGDPLLHR